MNESQIKLLTNNNYKVLNNIIIDNTNSCPPIDIIYDEETHKFCLGIKNLKIFQNDFNDFKLLFNKFEDLIDTLNRM